LRGVGKLQKNRFQDNIQPTQDVTCGEPEHPKPATLQPGSPSTVVFDLSIVGRTVDLDQQPRLEAGEVGNVRTDRRLPPEPVTSKLAAAEARPEQPLHPGHAAAERSGFTERNLHDRRM
jgi:hypothetical protein